MVASDGPGEYTVVAEARAGDDALGVVVAPGTVAYVTTGGAVTAATLSLCLSPRCRVPADLGELMRLRLLCWAGPIPDGADAVVQVEDTQRLAAAPDGSKRVRISVRIAEGHDIRSVVSMRFFDTVASACCLNSS